MNEIRVSSWIELTECLYEGSWHEPLGRFRSPFAYRGMGRAHYDLRTSLFRLGGRPRELEEHILRAFIRYAHSEAVPGDSVWNWLALAQHHGVATRLLDWTYSPLVGMHFATENSNHFDLDGVIWCVDFHATNDLLPAKLKQILEEEGADAFTGDMLHRAAPTLRDFDWLSEEPFVAFFEPPSLDARIVNQYALFSLLSSPRTGLDAWLEEHPDVFRKVIVPADLKWEVRDKLDQANITERVLYPGLDGLGRWITRYYTPRGETDAPQGGDEVELP